MLSPGVAVDVFAVARESACVFAGASLVPHTASFFAYVSAAESAAASAALTMSRRSTYRAPKSADRARTPMRTKMITATNASVAPRSSRWMDQQRGLIRIGTPPLHFAYTWPDSGRERKGC